MPLGSPQSLPTFACGCCRGTAVVSIGAARSGLPPRAGGPNIKRGGAAMPNDKDRKPAEQPGEGNREADRQYREATERFVSEGGVDPAAKEARRAIDDEDERRGLEEAERAGR